MQRYFSSFLLLLRFFFFTRFFPHFFYKTKNEYNRSLILITLVPRMTKAMITLLDSRAPQAHHARREAHRELRVYKGNLLSFFLQTVPQCINIYKEKKVSTRNLTFIIVSTPRDQSSTSTPRNESQQNTPRAPSSLDIPSASSNVANTPRERESSHRYLLFNQNNKAKQ